VDASDSGTDLEGGDVTAEAARLRWRNGYLTSRIRFLEARQPDADDGDANGAVAKDAAKTAAKESAKVTESLRARIAELETAEKATEAAMADRSGDPAPNVDGAGGSLEWRNRYLASRVRYLERQLEEKGSESGSASEDELRTKLAKVEAEAGDAARLRARISELERSLDRAKSDDDGAAKNEGEYALEWRNRYLSSRVKYLEDRLAKTGGRVSALAESDAS